jgi:hypothetical protein
MVFCPAAFEHIQTFSKTNSFINQIFFLEQGHYNKTFFGVFYLRNTELWKQWSRLRVMRHKDCTPKVEESDRVKHSS